jgi:hypothetical protein
VGTDLDGNDYVSVARGLGIPAERVTTVQELLAVYEDARRTRRPLVVDCVTDKDNTPDCLLSFALVEFEGALKYLSPFQFLKSVARMQRLGVWRNVYQLAYIFKALLGINLRFGRS